MQTCLFGVRARGKRKLSSSVDFTHCWISNLQNVQTNNTTITIQHISKRTKVKYRKDNNVVSWRQLKDEQHKRCLKIPKTVQSRGRYRQRNGKCIGSENICKVAGNNNVVQKTMKMQLSSQCCI